MGRSWLIRLLAQETVRHFGSSSCEDAAQAYTFLKVNDGMQIGNSLFDEAGSDRHCHYDGSLLVMVGHKGSL